MKGRGAADGAGTAVGVAPKLEKPVDCCWNGAAGGVAKASKPENEDLLVPPPPPPTPEGVPKGSNDVPLFTGSLPNASKAGW